MENEDMTPEKQECIALALEFRARGEFRHYQPKAYRRSKDKGWLEEICSHMGNNVPISYEECALKAQEFNHLGEFKRKRPYHYAYAKDKGWIKDICSHVQPEIQGNNTLYFWKVLGKPLWKIGICNRKRLNRRIANVAKSQLFEIEYVKMLESEDCRDLENMLLKLGTKPKGLKKVNGYTEFRILSPEELKIVYDIFE